MCIFLNVKKHEKTFALNVDIFKFAKIVKKLLTIVIWFGIISELDVRTAGTHEL